MGIASKNDSESTVLLEYRTTARVPASAAQEWLSDGWNYITPSQCESCIPVVTASDDCIHQATCPNRKDTK